ncbi:transposable element Tcb2 transposase [Trichonephila clavipes]|nr:transposable element Tcb2 transposase [Trichonephila clavipes]
MGLLFVAMLETCPVFSKMLLRPYFIAQVSRNRYMGNVPSEKIVGETTSEHCLPAKSQKKNIKANQMRSRASITETATCLNSSQAVSKLWKQFQNDGTVIRRPGQGRKRMTTASEDRYLALTARRNRKATARQLSSELAAATGAKRLNEKGLYARKPRVCVLLSSQKKRDRFNL